MDPISIEELEKKETGSRGLHVGTFKANAHQIVG